MLFTALRGDLDTNILSPGVLSIFSKYSEHEQHVTLHLLFVLSLVFKKLVNSLEEPTPTFLS